MREYLRSIVLFVYIFLARRGYCPCLVAGKINRVVYIVGMAISKVSAFVGGRLCHFFDGLVRETDNVCGPDCQGCRPQANTGQSDGATVEVATEEAA